jgi:protein-tyrosine phosphatase
VFENLLNFRDLGGRVTADGARVRAGLVFRSESVAYLSEADVARLVGEVGIATVVDLRGEREVARNGRGLLEHQPVRYLNVPITDVTRGIDSAVTFYVDVLVRRGNEVAGLLRALLEPGALPAVVHCEAGCDRTGVVAALVLGLLGVPDDDIVADFELTRSAFPAMNDRWRQRFVARGNPPERFVEESWVIRERAMELTIAAVRERWGGWEGWAEAHGLRTDDLSGLRKLLLEAT